MALHSALASLTLALEGQYIVGTILAVIGYSLDLPPVLQIPVVGEPPAGGAGIGAIIDGLRLSLASTSILAWCRTDQPLPLQLCGFSLPQFHQPNSTSSYPLTSSATTLFLWHEEFRDGAEAIAIFLLLATLLCVPM